MVTLPFTNLTLNSNLVIALCTHRRPVTPTALCSASCCHPYFEAKRYRCYVAHVTLTTRPWRVSGELSNKSLCITAVTEADRRQFATLRSISRYFITGSGVRLDWDSCPLLPMSKNTMLDYWQHERFGVHYCHPTSRQRGYCSSDLSQGTKVDSMMRIRHGQGGLTSC